MFSCALLLPISVHSYLPKTVHLYLPIRINPANIADNNQQVFSYLFWSITAGENKGRY